MVSLARRESLAESYIQAKADLAFRLGPKGLRVLEQMVDDALLRLHEGRPISRQHIDAAKTLVDRAGFRVKDSQGIEGKELSELTREELSAVVAQGEAELAKRAKPVSAAESKPQTSDLADLIE